MPRVSKARRAVYRKIGKKSLCRGKSYKTPNKCTGKKKMGRSCKISKGVDRTYCRKKKAKRYSKRNPNPYLIYGKASGRSFSEE